MALLRLTTSCGQLDGAEQRPSEMSVVRRNVAAGRSAKKGHDGHT